MGTTIYLIHHTHTDIGYTELQGRITDRQVDFIRQALRFVEEDDRFCWTCETFWAVEQFLKVAAPDEEHRFVEAVRAGRIGLSASYVNYSELLDYATHRALTRRARAFADAHGLPLTSAMTADINGHALGYARALCDDGVEHLFACVHTYHGMYPLFRNQVPFYWQLPGGQRLLVWSGDHYHLGNELGLVPGAWMSHMVDDTIRPGDTNLSVAERRIPRYLEMLQAQGYRYDFVPLMVSGLMTDNAPPSPRIPAFLETWNARHGDAVRVELTTLDAFFDVVRGAGLDLPVYEGLWPDWWADLTVATPAAVQVFREGQRQLALYRSLADGHPQAGAASPRDAVRPAHVEDALALFAEHTFGHSATYTHPDHLLVAACLDRKRGYAAEAYDGAQRLVDRATARRGGIPFQAERSLRFRLLNPYDTDYTGYAALELDGFEWGSVDVRFEPEAGPAAVHGIRAADVDTGEVVPSQAFRVPRGIQLRLYLTLAPGATRTVEIQRADDRPERPFVRVSPHQGIDGARDVQHAAPCSAGTFGLETPTVRLAWRAGDGIVSWVDRATGRELLDPERAHQAFTPVYEVSPGSPRTPMGRNRKGLNVERSAGRLVNVRSAETGTLFATVVLDYALPGTRQCTLLLRACRHAPRVEVEVSLHKETCRDVESVYLALPFTAGPGAALWIDTSVRPMRPWHDQLPGTLTDFYHLYHGYGLVGDGYGVSVAMPDTPLLQLGDLAVRPRLLAGMPELAAERQRPYAWLMNNVWETNANVDLAGFYRFRYTVSWGAALATPEAIVEACRLQNQGLVTYRSP